MNPDIDVTFTAGDDSETAQIKICDIGCVSELRFQGTRLSAVSYLTSLDLQRILEGIALAERKRIDPNQKTIEAIEFLNDRIDNLNEDKSRLHLGVEMEMPIASCGSVKLAENPTQF